MAQRIRFQSFVIDAVTRTPITVPAVCHSVIVVNQDRVNDCTLYDANAGGDGLLLPAGGQQPFNVLPHAPTHAWPGFETTDTVVWATAIAGTGPLLAIYVV